MYKRGFTLVEVIVTIGIMLGLIGLAAVPLQLAREQPRAEARAFAHTFETALMVALSNNGTGSGALLVITTAADGMVTLRTLANRPLPGYDAPIAEADIAPQNLPLPVSIENGKVTNFSIAISPQGKLDMLQQPVAPGAAPVATAPGCGTDGKPTVTITIGTGIRCAAVTLSCSDGTVLSAS